MVARADALSTMTPGPELSGRSTFTLNEILATLAEWRGDDASFLKALLDLQTQLCGAVAGVVVRDDQVVVGDAAGWGETAVQAAVEASSLGQACDRLHDNRPIVAAPLDDGLTCVLLLNQSDPAVRMLAAERLTLTAALWHRHAARCAGASSAAAVGQFRGAFDLLAIAANHADLPSVALAFCNAIARQFDALRVSLGVVGSNGLVRVVAVSDTDDPTRRSAASASVAVVMAECAEQDRETMHPNPAGEDAVTRAAAEHARDHGAGHVVSLPLRLGERIVAVLTVERATAGLTPEEALRLRLACDLLAPRIEAELRADRIVSPRLANRTRRIAAAAVGPRHTGAKLFTILALVAGILPFVITTADHATGTFLAESADRRVVSSPVTSPELRAVHVRPGDAVEVGTLLAELDTTELELRLAAVSADAAALRSKASAARAERRPSAAAVADLEASALDAERVLLERQIESSSLRATTAGVVLTGDVEGRVGGPVRQGEALLTIGSPSATRVVVWIDEDNAARLQVGQSITLRAAATPGQPAAGRVVRVSPIVEKTPEGRFVRVWAETEEASLLHGTEGRAAVEIGQASLAEVWSRPIVAWFSRTVSR